MYMGKKSINRTVKTTVDKTIVTPVIKKITKKYDGLNIVHGSVTVSF